MWIPVWNKCKNRGTGFSTVFFTVCSYVTIVLEIGTLNFYSWQQVEGDEQRDCSGCAGERQDANSVTWRVWCFNNLAHLGAARQQPPEASHHSFLYTWGCCQLSVCPGASPVPWCCHTRVLEGEEGRRYLDEPCICSIIPSPLLSVWCLNFIFCLLCKQGTAPPWHHPAPDTSLWRVPAFAWPLLPSSLPHSQDADECPPEAGWVMGDQLCFLLLPLPTSGAHGRSFLVPPADSHVPLLALESWVSQWSALGLWCPTEDPHMCHG